MLSIGDFSKISRVPIKTLRYYDEIGLLKPESVDRFTGYRYYSFSQLPRLNRILALKDLNFSLEQIARVLNEGVTPQELRGMLRLKQAEIQQRLSEEQERLGRVEARLNQIERENIMPDYDVIIKKVEPQLVASLRQVVDNYQDVGKLMGELAGYLGRFQTGGPGLSIWHDEGFKAQEVDAEAAVLLKSPVPESDRVKVYHLPAYTMASVIHKGSYKTLNLAYQAVMKWIEENGYRCCAPNREIYLYNTMPVSQDDDTYVTELQFPVEKV